MTEYTDPQLGQIVIVSNKRAKRFIARRKSGFIQVTVPEYYSMKKVKLFIDEIKPKLLELPVKTKPVFDNTSSFSSLTFTLKIEKHNIQNYYATLKNGILHIICPHEAKYEDEKVQMKIRSFIENALRAEAKRYLVPRLALLAQQNNFRYTDVRINKSRTRWGSCSSKKSINLSYFCMLLPLHLADFIILHELCHTMELNHGERFWALLDSVCGNRARLLTQELKNIKIDL